MSSGTVLIAILVLRVRRSVVGLTKKTPKSIARTAVKINAGFGVSTFSFEFIYFGDA